MVHNLECTILECSCVQGFGSREEPPPRGPRRGTDPPVAESSSSVVVLWLQPLPGLDLLFVGESLLEGPLARLQELTFLGLWGEFMKGKFRQEPAESFIAVVGDGGRLLKASGQQGQADAGLEKRAP